MNKKLAIAALPFFFCGCFSQIIPRPHQSGVMIAERIASEPALALANDTASGRYFFAWTSLRGAPGTRFTLVSADRSGKAEELWRSAAEENGDATQFEPGLSVSSSSLYSRWIENSSGTLSIKAAVYDLRGNKAPNELQVSNLSSRVRAQGSMIPAGNGSVFLAWEDFSPTLNAPFAGIAELGPQGVAWKTLLGNRASEEEYMNPALAVDGAGGVFAAARHIHSGDKGIVLDHFNPDGTAWADDAQANTFMGYQSGPVVAPAPDGGIFLLWEDGRAGDIDIYGQKTSSAGTALWDKAGLPLVTADGNQWNPVLVPDAAGGFFCAWIDDSDMRWQLKVQRISKDGRTLWGPDGIRVFFSDSRQSDLSMVSDGAGGVILSWNEPRYGYLDIFAQRFGPDGARIWPDGGVPVTADDHDQIAPVMTPDGNGGGLLAWKRRHSRDNWEIRAQRLDAGGKRLWQDAQPAQAGNGGK
ncbi:MAG: hypothetical protein NTY45_04220 [Elusimicrobia bacterium]|nr:hypothetical protein [Elusimicrobiota bacterium]